MSRRKKPDRSRPDHTPPVSPLGAIYGCAALAFLVTGLVRGELVSSICGGLLLSYELLCLSFALAARASTRSASARIVWLDERTVSASVPSLPRRIPRPFANASLVTLYRVEPETPFAPPFVLSVPFTGDETTRAVPVPPRGFYVPVRATLVVSDVSDYFALSRTLGESARADAFTVYPQPAPPHDDRPIASAEGIAPGKSAFRRSDDLYESRPFVPGDDQRKIHWGLYAHTGELFLREGELLPPPADEYVLAFVTNMGERPASRDRARARANRANIDDIKRDFDALVDRAATLALALVRQGKTVTIPTATARGSYEQIRVGRDTPDADGRLLSALARVQPGHRQYPITDELRASDGKRTCLLFMTSDADTTFLESLTPSARLYLYVGPWDNPARMTGRLRAADALREDARLVALRASLANGGFNVSKA